MTNMNVAASCAQHRRSMYIPRGKLAAAGGSVQAATDISNGNVACCRLQASYEGCVRGIISGGSPHSYISGSDLSSSRGKCDRAVNILSDNVASLYGNIEIVAARHVNFVGHVQAAIAFLAGGSNEYDAARRVMNGEKKMPQGVWIGVRDLGVRPYRIAH